MSMTPEDAAQERFYDEMYTSFREGVLEDWEVYDRIVDDFKEARLRDYYLEHSGVIEPPQRMLDEARSLLTSYPRASLVLAFAAGEIGLRDGFYGPILHGCFHTDSAAEHLVGIIIKEKRDNLRKSLHKVLVDVIQIDLSVYRRSGVNDTLLKEIDDIRKIRNRVLHDADTVKSEAAAQAIAVSEHVLNDIFPTALQKLGLHLHTGSHVCGSSTCQSS